VAADRRDCIPRPRRRAGEVRLLVDEAKARDVGRLEPGGLETRQYGATMEELLLLTLMSSRLWDINTPDELLMVRCHASCVERRDVVGCARRQGSPPQAE